MVSAWGCANCLGANLQWRAEPLLHEDEPIESPKTTMAGTRRVPSDLRRLFDIVHCTMLFAPNNIARQLLFAAEESGRNGMAYQSVNPSNGELLRTFDEHTDKQMEEMLVTAEQTFFVRFGPETHPRKGKRRSRGVRFADARSEGVKFARLATLEMWGKRIAESSVEA